MKKALLGVIALLFIFVLSACGNDNSSSGSTKETIELKLGTKMPQDTAEGQAFEHFAKLVSERSNGELKVKVYPAEQLGKGTTQLDNMQLGSQDMYAEGAPLFADVDPRMEVGSIPYLFRDFDHYQKYSTGEMGQEVNKAMIEKGVRILNTKRNFVRGPYRVMLSKKPIKSVEDLKGLKLRSFESAFYSSAYKSVEANPTVVAWTETYLALKQNLVDAVTSPISLVWPMKFSEVAPYMTVIDEYPQDVVIAINEDKFSSLSKEQQKILIDAANETGEYAKELTDKEVKEHLELMKKEHHIEIFEINKEEWVNAFADFHYQLEKEGKLPKGYVDQIKSIK
ncbi:TRAP transporter substrate-binding protein [Neobacillus mesonae]|uniref:TRAP transporter substrate-binding protein n=1 Tax=Neobacillus mesonae TaxID=1193713 RepID=UPI002041D6E5|nr:TRAP transporter substrate-binding protein [Neobacillus mesonae]MCM3569043.1 TRAP transporter substrate-binding protein [Neobacillus mesonae]